MQTALYEFNWQHLLIVLAFVGAGVALFFLALDAKIEQARTNAKLRAYRREVAKRLKEADRARDAEFAAVAKGQA